MKPIDRQNALLAEHAVPVADYGLREWLRELPSEEAGVAEAALVDACASDTAMRGRLHAFGDRSFQHFRVSRRHAPLLTRRLSDLAPANAAKVLGAARSLIEGRSPLGGTLESHLASEKQRLERRDLEYLRDLLRQLFLHETDLRLQVLYRAWLNRQRPEPGGEVAALAAGVGPWAYAFLEGLDIDRLMRWLGDAPDEAGPRFLARLQNLAFSVKRVNLRFTHHCNLSCAHCYNASGPDRKAARLDDARALDVIRQLRAAGVSGVNFTGGEPFLYQDSLIAMVREARAQGLREISILTNGFWGTTTEQAQRVLDRLAGAGFDPQAGDWIKVSCGVYHQEEGMRLEGVAVLARAYSHRFSRPIILDVERLIGGAGDSPDPRTALHGFGVTDQHAVVKVRDVAALGRGKGLADQPRETFAAEHFGPCPSLTQLAIDPDGRCRPCCGLNDGNEGLVIGSVHDDSLRDIIKRMQNHPLLQAMAREPLGRLLERLPTTGPKAGFGSNCELCSHALGRQNPQAVAAAGAHLRARSPYYPLWLT